MYRAPIPSPAVAALLRGVDAELESLERELARLGRFAVVRDAVKVLPAFVTALVNGSPRRLWPPTEDASREVFRTRQAIFEAERELQSDGNADVALAWLTRAREELDAFPVDERVFHVRAAKWWRTATRLRRELAKQIEHHAPAG